MNALVEHNALEQLVDVPVDRVHRFAVRKLDEATYDWFHPRKLDADGNPHEISEEILTAVVGEDVARQMITDAETEAMESGEFGSA